MRSCTLATALLSTLLAGAAHSAEVQGPSKSHDTAPSGQASTIRFAPGVPRDIFVAGAVCGERLYLLTTPRASSVVVVDMGLGKVESVIGQSWSSSERLRETVTLGADCRTGRIYIVEGMRRVVAAAIPSGQLLRALALPEHFVATPNANVVVGGDGESVYVAGLWPGTAFSYLRNAPDQAFKDLRLGVRLGLSSTDAAPEPLFEPLQTGCDATTNACVLVAFDRSRAPSSDTWVMAHAGAARVDVFDGKRAVIRTIDLRSPAFVRDGTLGPPPGVGSVAERVERALAWSARNSVLRFVWLVGGHILAVHTRVHAPRAGPGQAPQMDEFLTIATVEGVRVATDIRLPGSPIAIDGESLVLLDYGTQGRRADFDELRVLRVPVAEFLRQ